MSGHNILPAPAKSQKYAFLARPPPPPQKKRPTRPPPLPPVALHHPIGIVCTQTPILPTCRRSPTFSHIVTWAAHVQPGSPVPGSPHRNRRLSTSSARRPSLTRFSRRPSIGHSRVPSGTGSFLEIINTSPVVPSDPSSPSPCDLTTLGYTTVFVHLSKTPSTPSPLLRQIRSRANTNPQPLSPSSPKSVGRPRSPKRPITKRLRAFSLLRSRTRTRTPNSPTYQKQAAAASVAQRKKIAYGHVRPPPLANDLALIQLMDGGSNTRNAQHAMESHAHLAGTGVGDVYRDGKGGMWWDKEEEIEYTHLLASDGDAVMEPSWVPFSHSPTKDEDSRRESVSTQDSAMDTTRLVRPADGQPLPVVPLQCNGNLLAIPARARPHLSKPVFLSDVVAFVPRSPSSPRSPMRPHYSGRKQRATSRRRPTPLRLVPVHTGIIPAVPTVESARRDFFEDSFTPSAFIGHPAMSLASPLSPAAARGPMRSMHNLGRAGMCSVDALPLPKKSLGAGKPSLVGLRALFSKRHV